MTTVVFNGKMLVADSRRTNGPHTDDHAVKVHTVEDRHYKGERILAIAGAGNVPMIEATIGAFLDDPDGFEQRLKGYGKLLGAGRRKHVGCAILFVTDKQAYRIENYEDTDPRVRREFTEPYPDLLASGKFVFTAIGSGGSMVTALHKTFNLPLPICVGLLSGIKRSATGGVLTVVEFEDGKLKSYSPKVYDSYEAVHAEAVEHVKSSECRYLGTIPEIYASVVGLKRAEPPKKPSVEKPAKTAPKKEATKKTAAKKTTTRKRK